MKRHKGHKSARDRAVLSPPSGSFEEALRRGIGANAVLFGALSWWGPWTRGIVTEGRAALETLYRLGVKPGEVLGVLALTRWGIGPSRQLRLAEMSQKKRTRDAKALENAARIIARWRPILERQTPWVVVTRPRKGGNGAFHMGHLLYPNPEVLQWMAACLRQGPSSRHRPRELELQACALKLARLIRQRSGRTCAREIGVLLNAAFPKHFSYSELAATCEEAATALLKRARRNLRSGQSP